MKENEAFWGAIGVLIAATIWGTTGTAATFAPDVSPLAIGSAAMGIGGFMQAILAANRIAALRSRIFHQWKLLLPGALAIGVYPLAFYSSMKFAGVAVGTVVSIGFAPLVSALLEWLFEGKRLTKRWVTGAMTGIAGAIMLCLAKAHPEPQAAATITNSEILGICMGLVAAATYALYSYTARRLMQNGITSRAAMGTLFGLGGIFLFPVLMYTGAPFLQSWSNAAVGVYMASVPMFLGYILFGYGLARIPASTATTLTLFEPAVATVLAVIIVGEKLPVMAWNGIGLIVMCLFILTLPGRGKKESMIV